MNKIKRLLILLAAGTLAAQTHSNTLTWTAPTTGDPATGYHVWRRLCEACKE